MLEDELHPAQLPRLEVIRACHSSMKVGAGRHAEARASCLTSVSQHTRRLTSSLCLNLFAIMELRI